MVWGEQDRALGVELTLGTHDLVPDLMRRFGDDVERLTLSRPTLEDVFLALTGERLES